MEQHKIYTIPNFITLTRLILAGVFIYYMIINELKYALVAYTIAVVSDSIDGFVARKYKQESALGRKMDAFVDGLLITSAFIMLLFLGYIGYVFALFLILPRIITAFVLYVYSKKKFFTTKYAKLAAFFTYSIIILLIITVDINLIYSWFVLIYLLSLLHWIKIIKTSKGLPRKPLKMPKFRIN